MEIAKNELGLESIKWGEFRISDLFEVIDGYYNKKPPQDKNGTIPFLGATQYDNGITTFYNKETILNYDKVGGITQKDVEKRIFKGNCIAITNNGSVGNAYYQKSDFVCSHDVTPIYLKAHTLNIYIALFIIPLLQQSGKSFEYAKKWRPKRMRKSKVMLPIDSKGEPNYKFMESFMKELEQKHLQKILAYYTHKLELSGGAISFNYQEYLEFIETLTPCQTKPLSKISQNNSISTKADDDKDLAFPYMSLTYICKDYKLQWGEFKISDLFEVYTGGDLILTNIIEGEIPIVSHSAIDNGVSVYTQTIPNRKKFNHKTTISLADRGNFFAATQKIDFYIGTRVKALEAKFTQVNYFILLFICLCINKQSVKFSYGKNCCANADSLKILLPLDSKGQPNYAFMESFMKELEQKHLQKILAYYTQKLESIRE
ncbi:hypothetical protein CQA66_04025 [Helicobacter aurati]|uniref:Type I restriction modification DNA specificity domain-containing protein n=1 Tax=Helicobacter aurati TaxID=137778 RepID=A0A3D8J6M1_9HELI|nr:restriction endonuclease subunit S [Helicobacter aurati]RDU72766.1 hypothetical protein CQA66_04025 [Helicobacter aurati]